MDHASLLADLNSPQLAAVSAPPGPLLVLAGPGSGKTHVITRRAAWLVATQNVAPQQMLCVTFTNRAAQEMQGRLEALLGAPARDIWVYTFHALCTRVLRRHAAAAGLDPYFVVADEGTQTDVLAQVARGQDLSLEAYPPQRVLDFISQHKRNLSNPAHTDAENADPKLAGLSAAYATALAERGLLDFDDLIGRAVMLLARERGVRVAMQRALPHILVDEYQDINRAQFELLKLLAPQGHDVLAVADEAQSIYGWRGAQPGLIADFRRHYRPTVIELERNYRSSQTILFAAEHLIRHNLPAPAHQLMASESGSDAEAPIYHYLFATGQQEQAWVTQLVRKLVAERGYRYSDIAILYRTHQLADPLEGSLLQAGIPLERVRRESFFQEPAVREVVRYLYLLHALAHSAESTSPGAFLGAFNFPQTLAGEVTVLQLDRLAATHRLPLAELARRSAHFPELSPLTRAQLQDFISLLDEQVVAGADEDAATAISSVFNVLARRRSPFTADEQAMLHDAAAFLTYPEAVAALKEGLAAEGSPRLLTTERSGRGSPAATARAAGQRDGDGHSRTDDRPAALDASPAGQEQPASVPSSPSSVSLLLPATVDGACAATILRGAVARYLGQELAVEFTRVPAPGPQLEIRPGEGRPPVVLHPPRGSLSYSLSTLAWRLAQELLAAYETTGSEPLVAYDLETTGVDVARDEIVEIAAQRLEQGQPAGPPFYSLVRPGRGIPLAASRVHGIYPEDVRSAPRIESVLPEFLRYVGPFTVVGHNITRFDNRLLDRETARLYGRGFPNPAVDTLEMAARLYNAGPATAPALGLEALLARFHLAERQEHRAGADVAQTIALFQQLLRESALQRGLASLQEYLPLVAAGILAAGVELSDENLALWQAGARTLQRSGTRPDGLRPNGRQTTGPAAGMDDQPGAVARPAAEIPGGDAEGMDSVREYLSAIAERDREPAGQSAPPGESQPPAFSTGDAAAFEACVEALQAAIPPPAEDSTWAALQERFAGQVETFVRFSPDHSLAAFLDYQALVTGANTAQGARQGDKVSLMTLHNAKGTEFPVVILIGVEEDHLPLWTTLEDEGQLREERRVFYVGLTRAQRQLYLTSARYRGDAIARAPSRFAFELPPEYVRRYEIGLEGQVIEVRAPDKTPD